MTPLLEHSWTRPLLLWHVAASGAAFLLFALDKFHARRGGERVPEVRLFFVSLAGGWPGALLAMLWLRHKTAKGSFQLKFVAAVLLWTTCAASVVVLTHR